MSDTAGADRDRSTTGGAGRAGTLGTSPESRPQGSPDRAMGDGHRGDPGGRGRTTIADGVVEKIAGMAAREVLGVYEMGGGLARTFGAMRDRVPGSGRPVSRGVKVEVGEVQTALDLEIVVEFGVTIPKVARSVRENVVSAVERMTGLEVVEVNIAVSDVKLPEDSDEDQGEDTERRLQ